MTKDTGGPAFPIWQEGMNVPADNAKPKRPRLFKPDDALGYKTMDLLAAAADFYDEQMAENHQRCFHCGAYTDECQCDGGIP